MTYYIFRHGLATKSKTGYGKHITSAKLLPEAILPIQRLAEFLKDKSTRYNASSEFIRCRETTKIVSKITGKKFVFDKRLNEFYDVPFEEFVDRIKNFLREMKEKKYESVALCSHAAVITIILKLLKNEEVTDNDVYTNYPLPGVLVIVEDKKIEEIDFQV